MNAAGILRTTGETGSRLMADEFDFIAWLRSRTPPDSRTIRGPGDDFAILAPAARPLLVTTDMLMDGTDFLVAEVGPRRAGRKAMAANLSDIAAMAGLPLAAVVSVALPKSEAGDRRRFAEELYLGLRDAADPFGVSIVGGDTEQLEWAARCFCHRSGRSPGSRCGHAPGRNRATGSSSPDRSAEAFGATISISRRACAKRLPSTARLSFMRCATSAMGWPPTCNHILEESHCGAVLEAEAIPVAAAAHRIYAASTGKSPLQHALGDGEDFELVFTVSPADGERLLRESAGSGTGEDRDVRGRGVLAGNGRQSATAGPDRLGSSAVIVA